MPLFPSREGCRGGYQKNAPQNFTIQPQTKTLSQSFTTEHDFFGSPSMERIEAKEDAGI